jgi:hypothetical protein
MVTYRESETAYPSVVYLSPNTQTKRTNRTREG